MEKNFNPHLVESSWYKRWEEDGHFKANPQSKKKPFTIMIPPPNVTGTLHMGHGFQNSLIDTLVRYKRMDGYDVLWQVGTDHAGIATQLIVERQLELKGIKKEDLGREKFIKEVWKWKNTSGNIITQQLRRLGASVDWSREVFTMDRSMSESVQKVFIDLHEKDLIYRGERLINWDTSLQTAVSDLEVDSVEEAGYLWTIKYLLSKGGDLHVATTRPETMFGDVAIAVHPKDKRYNKYIGERVLIPILNKEIPIISDDYVDKEFGTGCLKITPGHDFNDYEVGKRHNLSPINILNKDGTLNNTVPKEYQDLKILEARKKIISDLKKSNHIVEIKDHKLIIPRGERSGSVLEPMLTKQWFLNAKKLSIKAKSVVRQNKTKFIPKNWENTYFAWMDNIQDWCISRQLWWGHRIPAWYDSKGNVYVGKNEKEVRKKYKIGNKLALERDQDVLDTWFSSSLWTFSTLGWPKSNLLLKRYHPTNVLVTGFDIIFFWVARMIMMTTYFLKEVPFQEIIIHGLVRDSEGQKMSKSKGNIIDPLDVIDGIELDSLLEKSTKSLLQPKMKDGVIKNLTKKFPNGIKVNGTDSLRLTFCSLASGSRDVNFDLERVEGYRNFCNKLWNGARFLNLKLEDFNRLPKPNSSDKIDLWMETKLRETTKRVRKAFDTYRFDLATQYIYEFIWNDFCDWYLEFIKIKLKDKSYSEHNKKITLSFAFSILEKTLRLAHPLMPFITEEIWNQIRPIHKSKLKSIMISPYPKETKKENLKISKDIEWLKEVISGIRNIRGELRIKPSLKINCLLQNGTKRDQNLIKEFEKFIISLTGLKNLTWISIKGTAPASSVKVMGKMKILIPLEGIIDPSEEIERLSKLINKLNTESGMLSAKLKNKKFIENAPKELVLKEKNRFNQLDNESAELELKLLELRNSI
ncbi:MAG: valine--tRNA ligase [SAR86 cluster bacterium]|jgi:valyl-tRNA synthetase|nr:valine--tRNA ligase [SAR86 cluster bacterium]